MILNVKILYCVNLYYLMIGLNIRVNIYVQIVIFYLEVGEIRKEKEN